MKFSIIIFYKWTFAISIALSLFVLGSCRKFLEVPLSQSEILSEKVFSDDGNAIGAVKGIYHRMVLSSFAGGGGSGISSLTGLSSDELHNIVQNASYIPYEQNRILPTDGFIRSLWQEAYQLIYQANDILEELERSSALSAGVKTQLKGEVLFVRAFCYFYMVNTFGDVPLILNTDYKENSQKSRMPVAEIYSQIITDLEAAHKDILETYPESERVRPNKATVNALLARVHLYLGNWAEAQNTSTEVINAADYSLVTDPSQVFLKSSGETIWQLASEAGSNTKEGANFQIIYGAGTSSCQLTNGLLGSFEAGDLRRTSWVGEFTDPNTSQTLYYPNKYKAPFFAPTEEFFVLLRLSEQYLIRAEAAARQDNLEQAITDLDKVRDRAGLDLIQDINPSISKEDLLSLIAQERRIEFFAEWGHRWFDLKRTQKSTGVLGNIKPDWSANDTIYPVPQSEFLKNPQLGEQNTGY